MTDVTRHQGSCLCGAVRFEIEGPFDQFALCHCSRCRKGTGSVHGANLFATKAQLNWTSGADAVRSFALAGTRHARSFCSRCGSAMPSTQMEGKLLVVPAGSLDTDLESLPTAHILCDDRANWEDVVAGAPRFPGFPG
ncbi:hypothetical protein PPSIR1_33094 [Plesiocystis pacifica SIR-1]|uniref:CENP-V/GFA domain-containing protein n=1 Tax=Plesiocystis pacifica SIR-1 TaxID=391625 RepID=A6G6H5_9BACT|nr:GFA family protein [Plesiocystis pacifica]EDM78452.1 hypothetical protein PPSIR1_33094 [Plesiocystis pacifica SIR-1]